MPLQASLPRMHVAHMQTCSRAAPHANAAGLQQPLRSLGLQAGDLRRLLEMYRLWQRKHFPLHGFDEALDQVADLGRSNRLKVCMRSMARAVLVLC